MKAPTTNSHQLKRSGSLTSLARFAVALVLAASTIASRATVVAHWTFDESSGSTAHDSAGTFDGTLSPGGAAFVPGGISGNAISLSLSSNGFVNMGNVLGLTSGDFSLVAWVKMNAGDTTAETIVLSKHEAFSLNGYILGVNPIGGGGQVNKAIFYEGSIGGSPVSTTTVNDGNWHQIVSVYHAGGSKSIYVDGSPAESTAASESFVGNSAPFLIGASGPVPTPHFTGLIDDVQIYNQALSDSEVGFLFQNPGQTTAPCLPAPSGLVSWWQGENNALDSADGNPGTLAGNTSFGAGQVGQAFVLDGNGDGVRVGNVTTLQLQDFTIEAWIKRASTTRASFTAGGGVFFGYGAGGYAFFMSDAGSLFLGRIEVDSVALAGVNITDTNFHHVAVTKLGTNVVFHVDGVAHPVPPYLTSFTFGTSPAIGARGDNLANSFLGSIDEVSVYNRALSGAEIQTIYNVGGAGKCRIPSCPEQLAAAQSQLIAVNATNAALQAQLIAVNATNAALQAQLVAANATNAALSAQLAVANAAVTSLQAQLSTANNANATLQAQLATCNNALAAANQNVQSLQNEILDLVLPLQLLTQTFGMTFHDPQFQIRGLTTVEQMQNLVVEILDLPLGDQQKLFRNLGGNKGKPVKELGTEPVLSDDTGFILLVTA